jgi:peptide chain release factor 2
MMEAQDFWENVPSAHALLKEKSTLEGSINNFYSLQGRLEDLEIMIELSEEEEDTFISEIEKGLKELNSEFQKIEIETMLSGEKDSHNAIVSIHPGAGGTESQDWAQMLMRMYLRWADSHNFKTEIIDILPGEEAGIKSVTIMVAGEYAYGYLKAEAGIHRLVRISPFDASKRRHTSFASVFVHPEIEEDIEIDIKDDDLRIETFRASGAGGQHVNKTSSAVRITHIPTGVVVQCQNERSQHKNKATAMKVLRSKLYELKEEEQAKKMEEILSEKKEIAWGSQIRSYILQPYQMVKDHRTNLEVGNVNAVLDGDIDQFIDAYLLQEVTK